MQITMGIGVLLLGGWVLNSPVDDNQLNYTPVPAPPQSVSAPALQPGPGSDTGAYGSRSMNEQSYRRMVEQERGTRFAPGGGRSSLTTQQPANVSPPVPTIPTQSNAWGPQPPTSPMTGQDTGPGTMVQPPIGSGGQQIPVAPTYQPPTAAPSSSSSGSYGGWGGQPSGAGYQPSYERPAGATQKPFSTVTPFSSGVSPYMNLFRRDTAGGTVDNYTTLVRPAIEQQMANQRYNMDIFGLERRARIQQSALQQVQQNTRQLQGVATPQFYMNTGGYYANPGYGP